MLRASAPYLDSSETRAVFWLLGRMSEKATILMNYGLAERMWALPWSPVPTKPTLTGPPVILL